MILSAIQPCYFPWIGYLSIISHSDAFCFIDNAQYIKRRYYNRNFIANNSNVITLNIPIKKHTVGTLINQIQPCDLSYWLSKHNTSIKHCYSRNNTSNPLQFINRLENDFSNTPNVVLSDITKLSVKVMLEYLEVKTKVYSTSDLNIDFGGVSNPNNKIISLCHLLGADKYLSGPTARNYLDKSLFKENGIDLMFCEYGTQNMDYNINLSAIHIIANYTLNQSKNIMHNHIVYG